MMRPESFSSLSLSLSPPAVIDKDLLSAKALHQQMQQEGLQVDELSLKRLAVLYRSAGEELPFSEPPVSRSRTPRLPSGFQREIKSSVTPVSQEGRGRRR